MKGQFITFEGSDGAGKTSVMNEVLLLLKQHADLDIVVTREPGGNQISEQIREVILDRKNTLMDAKTEALLYAAARRQHLIETVIPALEANKIVLCDRYIDSSIAYQGAGRKIGEQEVAEMNLFATDGLMPDKTLYFDIPVEVGLKRISNNRQTDDIDRLDVETIEFHKRVNAAYQHLVKQDPERFIVIDATQPLSDVVEMTYQAILNNI
ncbi:dTMP kinase [Lentilactobacillus laojiaonis]|uniref:dTMP kinase n=1 Tax=Lentilactobacillus laojiaonis TaxID=2883998 RepID=UPI001D09E046|nr:dTMP kinase [Lentilactobacillus laojiaonis]UDM31854.1 dTMP kinase [Lentilactobacillus laojiaonis]